jgi:peptidoglycan/LPS O-acetylase OafA/YrhL
MPDILTGALLANLYFYNNTWIQKLQNLVRWKIILVYGLGFLLILFKTKIFTNELIAIERFVYALFFAFVVLDQIHLKNSFFKIGKVKLFNHLGKISYGLYMYHLVILFLLHKLMTFMIYKLNGEYYIITILYFILGVCGTYLISLISHKFIERPFLKLKHKFV